MLIGRRISSLLGLSPVGTTGIDLYAISAKNMSSWRKIFFAVWTARSASPLDWGKWGLLVVWVNPYTEAKVGNYSEQNWIPLSVTSSSGIPHRAKMFLSLPITWEIVVLDKFAISR